MAQAQADPELPESVNRPVQLTSEELRTKTDDEIDVMIIIARRDFDIAETFIIILNESVERLHHEKERQTSAENTKF
jgi:hypothetical protein